MTYSLLITEDAELDLADAALWYEVRKPNLGHEFIESVESVLQFLQTSPMTFRLREENVRIALVKRFPYKVIYTLEDNLVIVHAIMHAKRDPNIWVKRL